MPIPILLHSDSVDLQTGLARITRDLAIQLSKMPEFRVATYGRNGVGACHLPWPQYYFPMGDTWGAEQLPQVWNNFTHGEPGIHMSIYDMTRMDWIVAPRGLPENLTSFLNDAAMARWAYIPIDSTGPNGKLTGIVADTISRYASVGRVLAYSNFAKEVIERSTGVQVESMPHGVNFKAFDIRDKVGARMAMGWKHGQDVIGVVATNQQRKDWGLVAVVANELKTKMPKVRWWWHIDTLLNGWNIHALIQDYKLQDHVKVTLSGELDDTKLSWMYSACDITILPSTEGFGYPIIESMACGVPVIHSSYGGGAELLPERGWLVDPVTYRLDTVYNMLRPVWRPEEWVDKIEWMLKSDVRVNWNPGECRRAVSHLDWNNMGPVWRRWFKEGIGIYA